MVYSTQLLDQAHHLATRDQQQRPRQVNLRRAVSAAYYALFHFLIDEACRSWVAGQGADRSATRAVLGRAFDHGVMKQAAGSFASGTLSPKLSPGLAGTVVPAPIKVIAATFRAMQQQRHAADYNLRVRYKRGDVLRLIFNVERSIAGWKSVRDTPTGRLFLISLLVNDRLRE